VRFEIAAGRCHIAQLGRRARQNGARQHRVALRDQRVVGEVGIWHEGADAQASLGGLVDSLERQMRDVDQPRRTFDVHLHEVDQVRAAGDELCRRIGDDLAHRVSEVVCPRVLEIDHDCSITCWIAATMLG